MKSERHFVVRYEDLVRDAEAILINLVERLDVERPADLTVQTVLGGRHPRKLVRYSSQPGVETPREVTNLQERFDYVDVVSERERNLIRLATWSLGQVLGYGLGEKRPDPRAVWSSWKRIDQSDFGRGWGIRFHFLNMASFLKRRLYVRRVCRMATR